MNELVIGDNTNAPLNVLAPRMLLCCGEDPGELLEAIYSASKCHIEEIHNYRCYRFWRLTLLDKGRQEIVLAWCGIGTGCIEPLLYELLYERQVVTELVLIGTAGWTKNTGDLLRPGACLIEKAYMGPTAFSALSDIEAMHPTLDVHAPSATIFSTDLYYLWNATTYEQWIRSHLFDEAWKKSDLIDMEVAQFYWLCHKLGGGEVKYAAIKGAANVLGSYGEQTLKSKAVLASCARAAIETIRNNTE